MLVTSNNNEKIFSPREIFTFDMSSTKTMTFFLSISANIYLASDINSDPEMITVLADK